MSAYLISTIEIKDPAGYEEYRKLVAAPLARYGGKFVVRGGEIEYMEGDWRPKRVVVVEVREPGPGPRIPPLARVR
jgi:uncharacterized protein (DUF1330 family)